MVCQVGNRFYENLHNNRGTNKKVTVAIIQITFFKTA